MIQKYTNSVLNQERNASEKDRQKGEEMDEKQSTVSVNYKIPLELKEKLQEVAERKGISMNALVIFYLRRCLEEEE